MLFPLIGQACLTLSYHMHGDGIGNLAIFVNNIGGRTKKAWGKTGEQGEEWQYATVDLDLNGTNQVSRVYGRCLAIECEVLILGAFAFLEFF